ncbi:MAG: shikimate kinase [Bacteroidota bacterium]|nr:shikimate kinase [Bacteroidota bacterium]
MAKVTLNKHIFLLGLPGSGKSTLAIKMQETYGFQHKDLDIEIARESQTKIDTLWKNKGECTFRSIERFCLLNLMTKEPFILACGGGTPVYFNSMYLMQIGKCIYLNASPEVLVSRIENEDRPMFKNADSIKTLYRLYLERRAIYERADFQLDATKDPDELCVLFFKLLTANKLIYP